MVGEWDASVGQKLDVVGPDLGSTAGLEPEPEGNSGGTFVVVL